MQKSQCDKNSTIAPRDGILQFSQLSRCWYAEANLKHADFADSVSFGLYDPKGGCYAEGSFEWPVLMGQPTPKLCLFDDGFRLFTDVPELAPLLAGLNDKMVTPEEMCDVLRSLGFEDATQTEQK